jgi:biotin synthase
MPILTPQKYRQLYAIYPDKACSAETGEACNNCLTGRIQKIDRHIARGSGGRRDHQTTAATGKKEEICHA